MIRTVRVWCNFNPVVGFIASSPYFRRDGEIAPKFGQKFDGALIFASCRIETAEHMKTGKHSFKRGIIVLHFGEKYASLLLPIFEEPWRTRWGYRADYRLLWSITQQQPSTAAS